MPRHSSDSSWFAPALHLCVLWSFAVAQPIFDVLARSAAFFSIRGSTPGQILLLTVAWSLAAPLAASAIIAALRAVSPRGGRWIQSIAVGLCFAVLVSPFLAQAGAPHFAHLSVAVAVSVVTAWVYHTKPWAQRLTWLAPAIVFFPIWFLGSAGIRSLLFPADTPTTLQVSMERTPSILLVVLDELPLASLLDENDQIDRQLFPHLGQLADHGTWYPNAVTIAAQTELAVPAILTGRWPSPESHPIASDYPVNLFSLLGDSYQLEVYESVTRIAPAQEENPRSAPAFSSLIQDVTVISGHVLLPPAWREHLPSIDFTWGGFIESPPEESDASPVASDPPESRPDRRREGVAEHIQRAWDELSQDRAATFLRFADNVVAADRPTLWFLHVLLPHQRWEYLPSGHRYDAFGSRIPGTYNVGRKPFRWTESEWPPVAAYQRHLLQAIYTDHLLGELLSRLRGTNQYDDAMVIVVSDHGCSFFPGTQVRGFGVENAGDIVPVPLLVKYPGQTEAVVDTRAASILDVPPTIADVLGFPDTIAFEGASLRGEPQRPPESYDVFNARGELETIPAESIRNQMNERLRWKREHFGTPKGIDDLFAIGPHGSLVGQPLAAVPIRDVKRRLECAPLALHKLTPGRPLPRYLRGVIPDVTDGTTFGIAAAVDGTLVSVGRSLPAEEGNAEWRLMLPEAHLESDASVDLFFVDDSTTPLSLARPFRPVEYRLGDGFIEYEGRRVRIGRTHGRAIRGHTSGKLEADRGIVQGWAADTRGPKLVEMVVGFINGRQLFATTTDVDRPGAAETLGSDTVLRSGFRIVVPRDVLDEYVDAEIRVIALSRGEAAELVYHREFPWPPKRDR